MRPKTIPKTKSGTSPSDITRSAASPKDRWEAIRWLRQRSDLILLDETIDRILRLEPDSKKAIFGNLFASEWPQCFSRLQQAEFRGSVRSIKWQTRIFSYYSKELTDHVRIRDSFLTAVLSGELKRADTLLNEHDGIFGKSIWQLGRNFLLQEEYNGTQANKGELKRFGEAYKGTNISIVAALLSARAEKNTGPRQFHSILSGIFSETELRGLFRLFQISFTPTPTDAKWNSEDLLEYLDLFPLVDRYDAFIRIALLAISQEHSDARRFQTALETLSEAITDPILTFALQVVKPSTIVLDAASSESASAWDAYVIGDYHTCSQLCTRALAENPLAFQYYELLVKSSLYLGTELPLSRETLSGALCQHLRIIYDKGDLTEDSLKYLETMALRLNDLNISFGLCATSELHAKPNPDQTEIRLSSLLERVHGPRVPELAFDQKAISIYLNSLLSAYPQSIALKFFRDVTDGMPLSSYDGLIPKPRILYFVALSALKKEDYAVASEKFADFFQATSSGEYPTSPFATEEARVAVAEALLILNDASRLQEVIVESFLERTHSLKRFPLDAAFDLSWQQRVEVGASIYFPTLAYITFSDPHRVSMALKSYLAGNHVERPSELLPSIPRRISKRALTFFLLKVCSLEVLDSLICFENAAEVETERICLLQFLLGEDPESQASIQSEILRVTQGAELRLALHKIEGSRVEINLSGMREEEESRFKELYLQFAAFKDIIPYIKDIQLQPIATQGDISYYAAKRDDIRKLISAQEGELRLFQLFATAFFQARDGFLNSPQFGLDSCLSVRIRHGILVQHIRRPFYQEKLLIDNPDPDSDPAMIFWMNELQLQSVSHINALRNTLSNLTESVLELATEVKDTWIQVRTEATAAGLFDYTYDETTLALMYKEKSVLRADYSKFYDVIFDSLMERTRTNLERTRNEVGKNLAPRLTNIILTAQTDIRIFSNHVGYWELLDALSRCRTEVIKAIHAMAHWFEGTDTALMKDVEMELAANTAACAAGSLLSVLAFFEISTHRFSTDSISPAGERLQLLIINRDTTRVKAVEYRRKVPFMFGGGGLQAEQSKQPAASRKPHICGVQNSMEPAGFQLCRPGISSVAMWPGFALTWGSPRSSCANAPRSIDPTSRESRAVNPVPPSRSLSA